MTSEARRRAGVRSITRSRQTAAVFCSAGVGVVAVAFGAAIAVWPGHVLLATAVAGLALFSLVASPKYLPALALLLFTLLPIPYSSAPEIVARFFTPSLMLLLVWGVRVLLSGGRGSRSGSRVELALLASVCAYMAMASSASMDPYRSIAWSVVVLSCLGVALLALELVDAETARLLLRTWAVVAVALAVMGLLESMFEYNPAAVYYYHTVDLSRGDVGWSVYRIRTMLGHPLLNSTFFACTTVLLVMLGVRLRDRVVLAGGAMASVGVLLTVTRGGVVAVAAGIVVGSALTVAGRNTSITRKLVSAILLSSILAALAASPLLVRRASSGEGSASAQYRERISYEVLRVFGNQWVFGSGPGTSGTLFSQMGYRLNIESAFLQLLISVGVAGTVAVLLLVLLLLARLLSAGGVEAVAGLTTFLVAVSTYNALDTYPGITSLVVLIVICGASARFTEGGPPSHPAAESQRVSAASGRLPSTKPAIRSREIVRGSS